MRIAFKEWAVVVDALGRGDQILILRKGGISEGRAGFQMEHRQFLLSPTRFHQQRESVLPPAQARFDEMAPTLPSLDILRVEFCAEVIAWQKIEFLETAQRLRGQHIWRAEVIAERYEWGKDRNIFALAVRVASLPRPIEIPMRESYGGCKSWIALETDIDIAGARPVLSDEAFAQKLARFHAALEPVAAA